MWDRKELKAKGKAAYNANKVACIIAALILMIAGGAGSASTSSSSISTRHYLNNNDQVTESIEDSVDGNDAVTIDVNGEDLDVSEITHDVVPMMILSSAVVVSKAKVILLITCSKTIGTPPVRGAIA